MRDNMRGSLVTIRFYLLSLFLLLRWTRAEDSCTFRIASTSVLDIKCGNDVEWQRFRIAEVQAPIEIAEGLQFFGTDSETGEKSLVLVENRSLDLYDLNLMEADFVETWALSNLMTVKHSTVHIRASKFQTSRYVANVGGLKAVNSTVFVEDCGFSGTSSNKDYAPETGAIRLTGKSHLEVSNSTFMRIRSGVAAIYADQNSSIEIRASSRFKETRGDQGGAIYAVGGSRLIMEDSVVLRSESSRTGAVTLLDGSGLQLERCRFSTNKGEQGAALHIESPSPFKDLGLFMNNQLNEAKMVIRDCEIESNVAQRDGGAMYVYGASLILENTDIGGNQAYDRGAGLFLTMMESIQILSCHLDYQSFSPNAEQWRELAGSALYAHSIEDFSLQDSLISDNQANMGTAAGAHLEEMRYLEIFNSTISKNSASYFGGLNLQRIEDVRIEDVSISDNRAEYNVGGLQLEENTKLRMRNVSFEGNAAVNGGAMQISSSTSVVMEDCTFSKNQAVYGVAGAVRFIAVLELTIANSQFLQNNAQNTGGGIAADNMGPITIEGTHFEGNKAYSGAGCSIQGSSDIVVRFSNFSVNGAREGKGGGLLIENVDLATIQDSTFFQNTAKDGGGAVATLDAPSVESIASTFEENQCEIASGGAFVVNKVDIAVFRHCVFQSNKALQLGGAMLLDSVYNHIDISNSTFDGNEAMGRSDSAGGALAVVLFSKMTVNATFFSHNKAKGDGGAIHIPHTPRELVRNLELRDNQFRANLAETGSGGAVSFIKAPKLVIQDCEFEANNASLNGGAVMVQTGGELYMTGSSFKANGLHLDAVTVEDLIEAEERTYSQSSEIGLWAYNGAENETIVLHPNRDKDGGAVALVHIDSVTIQNTVLTSNKAPGNGGALSVEDAERVVLEGVHLSNNTALTSGGGVSTTSVQATVIAKCNFALNNVRREEEDGNYLGGFAENGGAMAMSQAQSVVLVDVIFSANTATESGGAVSFDEVKSVNVSGGTFAENFAQTGGAMHMLRSKQGSMEKNKFIDNLATESTSQSDDTGATTQGCGGALVIEHSSRIDINRLVFERNWASGHGAAVALRHSDGLSLSNLECRRNRAQGRGGCLDFLNVSDLTLSHSVFQNNTGSVAGGAISLNFTDLTISDVSFAENQALNGALLMLHDSFIEGDRFDTSDNVAGSHGGLVYCQQPGNITIQNSEFRNDGSREGDAIFAECHCRVKIQNSKFACTTNKTGCGQVHSEPSCPQSVFVGSQEVTHHSKTGRSFWLIPLLCLAVLAVVTAAVLRCLRRRAAKRDIREGGTSEKLEPLSSDLESHLLRDWGESASFIRPPFPSLLPPRTADSALSVDRLESHHLTDVQVESHDDTLLKKPQLLFPPLTTTALMASQFTHSGFEETPFCPTPDLWKDERRSATGGQTGETSRWSTAHTILEQQELRFEYDEIDSITARCSRFR